MANSVAEPVTQQENGSETQLSGLLLISASSLDSFPAHLLTLRLIGGQSSSRPPCEQPPCRHHREVSLLDRLPRRNQVGDTTSLPAGCRGGRKGNILQCQVFDHRADKARGLKMLQDRDPDVVGRSPGEPNGIVRRADSTDRNQAIPDRPPSAKRMVIRGGHFP